MQAFQRALGKSRNNNKKQSKQVYTSTSTSNQVPVKELFYYKGNYIYPPEQNEADIVNELLHFSDQVKNICIKYEWKINDIENNGRKIKLSHGIEAHYINFTENSSIRTKYNNVIQRDLNNDTKLSQIKSIITENENLPTNNTPDDKFDYQIILRFNELNRLIDDDDKNDDESDFDILIDVDKDTSKKIFNKCTANI